MLGKLARELRTLGYDVAYAHGSDDDRILQRAEEEERLLLTRDRDLADRAGSGALLLESRHVDVQLARVIDELGLAPSAEAFLSRCLECNTPLEPADEPQGLPESVEDRPHWRCPSCERIYWAGTHTEDMLDRLGEHLPPGADRKIALDPVAGTEEEGSSEDPNQDGEPARSDG